VFNLTAESFKAMRTVHWLFVVGVTLFICGIGFVLVGERAARRAPVVEASGPRPIAVATVKQIMKGITGPAADVVYNAVSSTVTLQGTEEVAPRNDQEWEAVEDSAAALVESGNLMLMDSRVVDRGDWVKISNDLIEAGKVALRAAEKKDADGIFRSAEAINNTCDGCHLKYQRGS